jgi:hypothetical protein
LRAMKMKLSEAYWHCQDKSGRLGGMAGSVVLYVNYNNLRIRNIYFLLKLAITLY